MKRTAGFSLIELLISTTILLVLTGVMLKSLSTLRSATVSSSTMSRVQEEGERALRRILSDLQRSSSITLAGKTYPFLFDDGNPLDNGFANHAHPATTRMARPGDLDFGPNREIVFLQPADADGDSVPDVGPGGNLSWSPNEISYVVVTGADGVNYLQRRVNAGQPVRIASHVERLVFDDQVTSGFAIPLRAVRVQIFFREPDDEGSLTRYSTQALTRMRNR